MKIGEIIYADSKIICNADKKAIKITVKNTSDRPIQVGSHYHFYETNSELKFPRELAYGKRLDIISGTAVRFEPGVELEVSLIDFSGNREIWGQNCLVNGRLKENK